MVKKWFAATAAACLLTGTVASGAMAFDDLADVPGAQKIQELKERGVINGVGANRFAPHERLTAQAAIPLIVKGLELSLAQYQFEKAPLAGDYFTNVADDAWYAHEFVIARVNGIPIDRDIDPNAEVTREQFVHWLMSGIAAKGDYAFAMIYIMMQDEDEVSGDFMGSIQNALVSGIVELNENGEFRPKDPITRAEAAVMLRNAIHFVETVEPIEPLDDPIASGELTVREENLGNGVRQVTLSLGEKPHPGWSVQIVGIDFPGEKRAVIRYSLREPDPAAFYPMVLTYPKAVTYVSDDIEDIQYQRVPVSDHGGPDSIPPSQSMSGSAVPGGLQ